MVMFLFKKFDQRVGATYKEKVLRYPNFYKSTQRNRIVHLKNYNLSDARS